MSQKLQIDPANSRAILIGASEFERDQRLPSLKAVINNLRDLENRLANPAVLGIDDVVRLDNRPYPDLIDRVRAACAAPMDCLILYYVGHGLVGSDGTLLLATANTTFEGQDDNAVPYRSLRRLIVNAKARVTVVILDCCFGGRAITREPMPLARSLSHDELEKFAQGEGGIKGSFLIASSSQGEESFTPYGARNSGFTGHLLGVLDKGLPTGSEVLTIEEVFDAVTKRCVSAGLPRPVKAFAEDAFRVAMFKNAYHADVWREGLQRLIDQDPQRAAPLRDAIAKMDQGEKAVKQTGANFDQVLGQLLQDEGESGLTKPLALQVLKEDIYQKYLQGNPFGLRVAAEDIVVTVEANGDTSCQWTKRGTATTSALRWVAFAAFGDTPLDRFDSIQVKLAPLALANGTNQNSWCVALNDTPTRKPFLAFFHSPVPIGIEFTQTAKWEWRELFAPLVKMGCDTWGHIPTLSVGPIGTASITFFLHRALGNVEIRNIGSGGGQIERLPSKENYQVIRWSVQDLNPSSRLLLELSNRLTNPPIR